METNVVTDMRTDECTCERASGRTYAHEWGDRREHTSGGTDANTRENGPVSVRARAGTFTGRGAGGAKQQWLFYTNQHGLEKIVRRTFENIVEKS